MVLLSLHRVVITGFGAVTPIGNTAASSWQSLLTGTHGIKNILELDQWHHLHSQLKLLKCHLAAPVSDIPIKENINDRLKTPRNFKFAEIAADEAIKCANIATCYSQNVGVFLGCGLPGTSEMYDSSPLLRENVNSYYLIFIMSCVFTNAFLEKDFTIFHFINLGKLGCFSCVTKV